ncbi:MAG: succinyl-diaminopimelate desuccinylase [Gammaproteobacteria bacterium]|nr:succinyl-diaminopimelate desuccinylase [Gammaproteobacteria bacterium]
MSETIDLALQLISKSSITPDDKGCQTMMAAYLEPLGFNIEHMRFGEVDNLWARRGTSGSLFVFAGHTDVVPSGPEQQWRVAPFQPEIIDQQLYGRGSADMKGSLAAMLTASKQFISKHPEHQGSIGFLITSDEEGPAIDGTVKVVETLQQRGEHIDWCLVGEPSSTAKIGDVVKNGRRGSISGNLVIHGKQGHVAYPHLAENPVHKAAPLLSELSSIEWDQGNEFFPPTTFQISNIHAGTGATNVIPGDLEVLFNLRFSTAITDEQIKQRIVDLLDHHGLNYDIEWTVSGQAFLTSEGKLIDATCKAIKDSCGYETELSTAGGTSDGRFIAPTGTQVIELGPLNATIHQINEHVNVDDLDKLSEIYQKILENLLL